MGELGKEAGEIYVNKKNKEMKDPETVRDVNDIDLDDV